MSFNNYSLAVLLAALAAAAAPAFTLGRASEGTRDNYKKCTTEWSNGMIKCTDEGCTDTPNAYCNTDLVMTDAGAATNCRCHGAVWGNVESCCDLYVLAAFDGIPFPVAIGDCLWSSWDDTVQETSYYCLPDNTECALRTVPGGVGAECVMYD